MEVFHVISWGAARVALEMLPPRSINVLVSAWYWVIAPGTMRKAEPLLRDRANLLLVDSGALSALKAGRRDYLGQQDHVFEIAGAAPTGWPCWTCRWNHVSWAQEA